MSAILKKATLMNFFESLRRVNIDFYTAHPLAQLSDAELEHLAQQHGLTVAELKTQMTTPQVEMTCPLCGRASTHLTMCKGCGGDAWGFELELAHGEDAIQRLRNGLAITLETKGTEQGLHWEAEQIHHAVNHAYQMGGCRVCDDCFHHTLPRDAYQICPLYLHSERTLEALRSIPFQSLLLAALNGEQPGAWVKRVFLHWTFAWNTAYQTEAEKQKIAAWRATLLHGALDNPEAFLQQSISAEQAVADLLQALGINEEAREGINRIQK